MTSKTSDYETQFFIAGNGQVSVELHYQAGPEITFEQIRINTTTINFSAGSVIIGQQYYYVNTRAAKVNKGQTVNLQVKYFDSDFMQAFVQGLLVGKIKLVAEKGAYILHDTINHGTNYLLVHLKFTSFSKDKCRTTHRYFLGIFYNITVSKTVYFILAKSRLRFDAKTTANNIM